MANPRNRHLLATRRSTGGGRRHGRVSTYAHGCKCELCKKAARIASAEFRERAAAARFVDTDGRLRAPVPDEQHGKLHTYTNRACRCVRCTKARSDYHYAQHPKKVLTPQEIERLRRSVGLEANTA